MMNFPFNDEFEESEFEIPLHAVGTFARCRESNLADFGKDAFFG